MNAWRLRTNDLLREVAGGVGDEGAAARAACLVVPQHIQLQDLPQRCKQRPQVLLCRLQAMFRFDIVYVVGRRALRDTFELENFNRCLMVKSTGQAAINNAKLVTQRWPDRAQVRTSMGTCPMNSFHCEAAWSRPRAPAPPPPPGAGSAAAPLGAGPVPGSSPSRPISVRTASPSG